MSINLSNIEAGESVLFSDDSDEVFEESYEEPEEMRYPSTESSEEEDPVDEQTLMRKKLITRIYLNEFPQKLKTYQKLKSKIEGMTAEELDTLRKEFEIAIGMKTSINGMTNMMMGGVAMLEQALCLFSPMNPTGLTQICDKDKEFQDDLKLVSLKYAESFNTRPEVRVGMTLTKNILLLDRVNKARIKQELNQQLNQQTPQQGDMTGGDYDNGDNMNVDLDDINDLFADI